jgi:mycothiol synthase
MTTVRPLSNDDDFEALQVGDPMGWMFGWWRDMERDTGMEAHWFVAEHDARPAGLAVVLPMPFAAGGTAPALLNVVPSARRRGVATALRAAVEDAVRGRLPGVLYSYFEGHAEAEAAVAAWGLREVGRHQESILELASIDRDAYAARSTVPGVELRPLGDLDQVDDAAWQELHHFTQARFREAPDAADGGGELPFEVFRTQLTAPWSLFEAVEDGERIGITFVMPRPAVVDAVNTFFTGVSSSARGRGIAVALKSAQALVMADAGVRAIYTQNMAGNAPILAANQTLGFVRDSGYVDVLVDLT